MVFNNKTKKIVCICLAVAMFIPIAIGIVYMFLEL